MRHPRVRVIRSLAAIFALSFTVSLGSGRAQAPPPAQPPASPDAAQSQSQQGGSATGGVFAPVLDSEKRPITAGGFVKTGPVVFKDISEQAGLTKWTHKMGTPQKPYILETIGSGVALLDYDHDGWLDIYMVNGSTYDALDGKAEPPHAALFHNNHDGTFTNVAEQAGVTNDRWGFGVAVGDYDNDGWPDLYVANYGKNRLYHNNHDGTFTDVAETAGVTLGNWSTGPSFGDYDGDGRLDLFVPGYIHWDMNNLPQAGLKAVGFANCSFRGAQTMCGPRGLQGEPDHLFHNNGDGTFTDVSEKAGVERQAPLLRLLLHLCRHRQRRQGGPARYRRLIAQLSLSQQRRRHFSGRQLLFRIRAQPGCARDRVDGTGRGRL